MQPVDHIRAHYTYILNKGIFEKMPFKDYSDNWDKGLWYSLAANGDEDRYHELLRKADTENIRQKEKPLIIGKKPLHNYQCS
jgi:hypothetical protein